MAKKDNSHKGITPLTKYRYWVGVCWLDSMRPDWQEEIEDLFQGFPASYVIHNKDWDDGEPQQPRKPHVHIMLVYPNTTTYNSARRVFNTLSAPGKECCNKCEPVFGVRNKYNYLIHDTKKCAAIRARELDADRHFTKFLYSEDDRVHINGFDIGFYEQISTEDKTNIIFQMSFMLEDHVITNYADALRFFDDFGNPLYREYCLSYSAHFERVTKAIYLKGYASSLHRKEVEKDPLEEPDEDPETTFYDPWADPSLDPAELARLLNPDPEPRDLIDFDLFDIEEV